VKVAGVPVVPGEAPQAQDPAVIRAAVASVGVPLILKAVAGGGGKGMRVVRDKKDIADAVDAASREALRAFGDGTLYVERLIETPRHIEVQIVGDTQGHVVHLFERDCTLQRRHQKVIEEAPAPRLAAAVRAKLLDAAVAAARAVGYVNAGTVEFLLEGEGDDAKFYFLEMNTRLQVEHPITEAITGIDLVRVQLDVAAGEPLPFAQADIAVSGHAVECRIYAEDSVRLLPQSGQVIHYEEPTGPGVRVDSGLAAGQRVTVHYDPLLAKLITHGATRDEALARAAAALADFEILGLHHNIAFLGAVLARPEVHAATCDTSFIERHLTELATGAPDDVRRAAAAIAAMVASGEAPAPIAAAAQPAAGPADVWGGTSSAAGRDPWSDLGRIVW
jgi:acetyl/propionyl-CoA carboxylase alpha subunit